eukprot:TRINITY_DN939_c0_g3_i1.p1 TRINITY_DN939_c0_g3~~TRINITY_DN939_c0_g3_i1.p1  ORF type:complete len:287 (-),score=92.10 TRINITY_DN939_c0_g3_i1:2-862(-)
MAPCQAWFLLHHAPAVVLVLVMVLVSSVVAKDSDVELLDESYAFSPNLVRSAAPVPLATASAQVAQPAPPKAVPTKTNPMQRLVNAIVSAQATRIEKRRLKRVTERYNKSKKQQKSQQQADGRLLAAQQAKMAHMQQEMAKMRVEQEREKKVIGERVVQRTKEAAAVQSKATDDAKQVQRDLKLPTPARVSQGQGAAVGNVKTTGSHANAPPPLDGIAERRVASQSRSAVPVTEKNNAPYDVGAAEAHVEKQDKDRLEPVSYTHLRAHETVLDLVCRLLLEKKKKN